MSLEVSLESMGAGRWGLPEQRWRSQKKALDLEKQRLESLLDSFVDSFSFMALSIRGAKG